MEIKVLVEGTGRGLLMHKFSAAATSKIENEVKRGKRVKMTPAEEAEEVAYRLDENKGQLCLPAEHFLGCLVSAASGFNKVGQGKKTYKGAFSGGMEVMPDFIGLTDTKGGALHDFAVDSRPVRIQKARIIRHRPFLKAGWRAEFVINVLDDTIPIEVVQSVLEEAGRSKCVGDYRPRFGQFRIINLEKV